jgi:uncharacterized membrane protein YccC
MTQPSSFWNRHAALVFSLRTFAAAMLAFSIALLLDMPRPYWAMASVYITSSQLTGATRSKAVYRILGTLIGAAGTIILVPNLVNAPEFLSLCVALWVGICLYLSLIDGTPRSYVFMLAGYTVALLGFPIVSMPQAAFDIVVSRVQEIILGIICASVVAMLVFPRSVASAVTAQADAWLAGARRLGVDVLTGRGSNQERDKERIRLAAVASEIDQLGRHLGYEATRSSNIARGLLHLRQHMLSLLPLLGSIEDRKLALDSNEELSARMADICRRTARWLEDGGRDGQEADALRAALDQVRPTLDAAAGWIDISAAGLVVRLRNLVDVMQDCQLLREAIAEERNPDLLKLAFMPDTLTFAVPHRDHGHALLSAASVALSCSGLLRLLDRNWLARRRNRSAVRCGRRQHTRRRRRSASHLPQLLRVIPHRHRHPWNLPVWGTATDHDPRDADCRTRAGIRVVRLDVCAARDRAPRFHACRLYLGAIGAD